MHKHPLFNNINHNIIPKHLNIISYPKDTLLFSEGEECKFLGVILSGEVKISTLTSKDNEYTISILKDNDIFGENLLFNQIMKVDIFSKIVLPDSRGGIVRKSLE